MRKQVLFGVLAVVLLFGVVGLASADTVTYNLAGNTQTGPVAVTASVNPKITLSVTTPAADPSQTVAFGAVDPGVTGGKSVTLAVDSNKSFDLTTSQVTAGFGGPLAADEITLTRTLAAGQANVAKGQNIPFTDDYSIDVPWTCEPGNYSASVSYTVTQNP
ncbi:hypothetical protein EG835_06435 [bacterium]|nr:hypothetical protein [bacterium]